MRPGALINSLVSDYRVIDFLGAGGMGEVYRAVHTKLGRVAAVKVLTHSVRSQSLIERFRNEARIQAGLHHPRIVALFEFVEVNGQLCIIMEYVDGRTLDEHIRASGPLPVEQALRIFKSIVEAISYIHTNGIIHRDIKSNNIKINSSGEVKLLDFGIAKSGSSPNLTMTGDVVGTFQYLSPEQLKGGTADARSDLWALGVLLYEMVSGDVPFNATTIGSLYEKIIKADYLQVSALIPSVPREVEAIISRCLKKNPSARYQSAQELFQDVERAAASLAQPVAIVAEEEKAALHKANENREAILLKVKRNWKALSAAAAVVLLIALGFYFLTAGGPAAINLATTSNDPNKAQKPVVADGPKLPASQGRNRSNTQSAAQEEKVITTIEADESLGRIEVWIDGLPKGLTPYDLESRFGQEHDLAVMKDGVEIFKDPHFRITWVGRKLFRIPHKMIQR